MASLDKLVKSLESLNFLHSKSFQDETSARRKEKISLCSTVTEMICSPNMKAAPNYSEVLTFAIESLLRMCNDNDSNVRMIADECLNKVIKAVVDGNIQKVLYELFKEMKKNDKARSLRAALWRFADLSHFIRPQKGRNYMSSLIPILINISARSEDSIVETLASSIPKIFKNLAYYATDSEIKLLTQKFLKKLSSPHTVHRRCAVQCVIGVCVNSKKPDVFLQYVLSCVLESILPPPPPRSSDTALHSLLGGVHCISQILSQYRPGTRPAESTHPAGRGSQPRTLETDTLLRVLELCLHLQSLYARNITVVMFSLECLAELFQIEQIPEGFLLALTRSNAFVTSRIGSGGPAGRGGSLNSFSRSQMSIASSSIRNLTLDEDSILSEDILSPSKSLGGDLGSRQTVESWIQTAFGSQDVSGQEDDTPSISTDPGSERKSPPPSPPASTVDSEPPQPSQIHNIGSLLDKDSVALLYCVRYLVTSYLLSHSSTRVGVQTVCLEVLTHMLRLSPELALASVDKDGEAFDGSRRILDVLISFTSHSDPQVRDGSRRMLDVLISFTSHSDPQVRGLCNVLIAHLVEAVLTSAIDLSLFDLNQYIGFFVKGILDESATCSRLTLSALRHCLPPLLRSHSSLTFPLLQTLLDSARPDTYWLNQIKLIELLSSLPYETLAPRYQERVLADVILAVMASEDGRIRGALVENVAGLVSAVYPPSASTGGLVGGRNFSRGERRDSRRGSFGSGLVGEGKCWRGERNHSPRRSGCLGDEVCLHFCERVDGCHDNETCLHVCENEVDTIGGCLGNTADCLGDETSSHVNTSDCFVKEEEKVLNEMCNVIDETDSRQKDGLSDGHTLNSQESHSKELVHQGDPKSSTHSKDTTKDSRTEQFNTSDNIGNSNILIQDLGEDSPAKDQDESGNSDLVGKSATSNVSEMETCDSSNRNDQRSSNIDVGETSLDSQGAKINDSNSGANTLQSKVVVSEMLGDTNRVSERLGETKNLGELKSKVSSAKTRCSHYIDYQKLNYLCSRDLNNFKCLDKRLSRLWKGVKLELFLDMFHRILTNEVRLDSTIPNVHLINSCVDLLNKLTEIYYPIETYRHVWLQSKYSGSAGFVPLLTKCLFANPNNLDLTTHSAIVTLLVRLLVELEVEKQLSLNVLTHHLVKTLSIVSNIISESTKIRTNTLKKNLEKISPIKNFTKDRIQMSPKSLHLPVTSFLAQPILSHVNLSGDILSPLREEELAPAQVAPLNEELYSKLYDTVANAYNSHRDNLKFDTDFAGFLVNLLENLSLLMGLLSSSQTKLIVNELSSSLSVVLNLEPCATVKCVYYIMKSVFRCEPDRDTQELHKGAEKARNDKETPDLENAPPVPVSPFDIFEPATSNDTSESRYKPKSISETRPEGFTSESMKTPYLKDRNKRSHCRNCRNDSFYENCIVGPLDRIRMVIENVKIETIDNEQSFHKSKRCLADDSNDFKSRYIIKKSKQVKALPDVSSVTQYLRMFEPCIVPLFKHYSSTADVSLQVYILKLLTYIIHLGFNYYNIDPELAFVQILIKQFDLFEHGYVKGSHTVIPSIVKFLLTLCLFGVEKSKANANSLNDKGRPKEAKLGSGSSLASSKVQDDTVISINKIIHICDELYASGQNLQEHCIPGLKHVVKYIFIQANAPKVDTSKVVKRDTLVTSRSGTIHGMDKDLELDTQQEVLFINLLKLVHYHEVIHMVNQILPETPGDVYNRRSSNVYATIIRHIELGTLTFASFTHIQNVLSLFHTMSPHVVEVDTLLGLLFKLTDFNEENILTRLPNTIVLLVILFRIYSLEEIFDSVVRNKFTSFSLDWNTELDPLHVSITLDAACVDPVVEIAKLLLYLLYQTVSSYALTSRSPFHTELILCLILSYEHLIQKYPLLRSKLVEIVREEKRKRNKFFCDLDRHLANESSAILCVHFARLTALLNEKGGINQKPSECDSHSTEQLANNGEPFEKTKSNVIFSSNRKTTDSIFLTRDLPDREFSNEHYKDLLHLLVSLQINEHSAKKSSNPESRLQSLLPKDNSEGHCKSISKGNDKFQSVLANDIVKSRFLQLVYLQDELPVHNFLMKYVKADVGVCRQILEQVNDTDINELVSNLNNHFVPAFSRFLLTYFNLSVFAEQLLVFVGKFFLSINLDLGLHDVIFVLLTKCSQSVLASKKCHTLTSVELNRVLNALFRIHSQGEMTFKMSTCVGNLIRTLLEIRTKFFSKSPRHSVSPEHMKSVDTDQWFLHNVKTLCHIPRVGEADPTNTETSSGQVLEETFSNSSEAWENPSHFADANIGKLLKKLSETDIISVVNHENFNIKLLTALVNEGKYALMKDNDGRLLEIAAGKLFSCLKEFLNDMPDVKQLYHPVHRFPTEQEMKYSDGLDSLFLQYDTYRTCEIFLDIVQEYFQTIDDLDVYFERHNENQANKSPNVRRSITVQDIEQETLPSGDSNNKVKGINPREVLNKLAQLNKQNSNEMYKFSLVLFSLLSYLIKHRDLFIHDTKLTRIVNKIISTNNTLMSKFSFIFNILVKEDEMHLINIINAIYHTVLCYKENAFTIVKHGNLKLSNRDSVAALYQLNTILQLIMRESELEISNTETETPGVTAEPLNITELFNLTLTLCKCDTLYTYARIPLHLWDYTDPVEHLNELSLALLPTEMLLNVGNLNDFVLRLKYVGWHSRLHFEQTWVILLTIITEISNTSELEDDLIEDRSALYTLTIHGITELLIQTQLVEPGNRKLEQATKQYQSAFTHLNQYRGEYVHSPRNNRKVVSDISNEIGTKVNNILFNLNQVTKVPFSNTNVNYEYSHHVYNVNQLSYNYLHNALLDNEMNKDYLNEDDNLGEVRNKEYISHMKKIKLINLDIQSCLHLLIDIYSQLLSNTSLKADIVESTLILSDLFDNYQHYEWVYSKFYPIIEQTDYVQAMHLMCVTKSLCFIKIDQKKDKLNGILKKITMILNATHTKASSELFKLASIKCLFYLLENYVEKYIHAADSSGTDITYITDKIKYSHLLNKTLDLIYNLIKTNVTWNSVELEINFTSLCLYVLETFQAFTPYCKYTPLVETLNSIVDYLCARSHYLNMHDELRASKLTDHIARLLTVYPNYHYLHKVVKAMCINVVKNNTNHSVDVYTMFIICIYNRYYTEKKSIEPRVDNIEESVDGGIKPTNESVETASKTSEGLFKTNADSKEPCDNVPENKPNEETLEPASATSETISIDIKEVLANDKVKDTLATEFIEDFFSDEKVTESSEPKTETIPNVIDIKDDKDETNLEDNDSFYKMITSKEKSNQIKSFISDTLQNKKEKIKNLIKVKTNFDPLSNILEKSTFYEKADSDMDETLNITETDHESAKEDTKDLLDVSKKEPVSLKTESKSKTKFTSYLESDIESTSGSEKDLVQSKAKQDINTSISDSNRITEDTSSINYTTDALFAIIELISLFLSRMKQLNNEEIELLTDVKTEGISEFPDNAVHSDSIRKSLDRIYKEADVLSVILPSIFVDFDLESDMLNRVVNEFFAISRTNYAQLKDTNQSSAKKSSPNKKNISIYTNKGGDISISPNKDVLSHSPKKNDTLSISPNENVNISNSSNQSSDIPSISPTENVNTSSSPTENVITSSSPNISSDTLSISPNKNGNNNPSNSPNKNVNISSSPNKAGNHLSISPTTNQSSIRPPSNSYPDFTDLHVQSRLGHILLHVLKHNQIDLINDWIVSTLTNLFDFRSIHLTRYYLFTFLCFACTNESVRTYFGSHRRVSLATLEIVVRTFYAQLSEGLKEKFVHELTTLYEKLEGGEEDGFRELFERVFRALEVGLVVQ
ncbi:hypothetical protein M8J77_024984 [Diaphorina citri]|nr:hypothetical protein M8J77_024984 [Diaphorina citri]